jgi:DNA-directed RNA polymerase specialized sigma24 family protein
MSPSTAQAQPPDAGREAELIALAQAGSTEAFLELAQHYERPLYRVVYATRGGNDDAASASLETFARAWRDIADFPSGRRVFPWLLRIARELPQKIAPPRGARYRGDAVSMALDQLRLDDRVALALRVVERVPYPEIASILDVPTGIVILRIAQARGSVLAHAGESEARIP